MNRLKKVNEDNWTGFHSGHMTNGINEAPVYDADLPTSVDILKGSGAPGGYVDRGVGGSSFNWNWEINILSKNTRNTEISKAAAATAGGGGGGGAMSQGLAWFGSHFNEIAIVGATVGIIAGLVALIKAANRQIKVRYNKVVKALQKAQKQFTLDPMGLDMKAVFPGFGGLLAKMGDVAARIFTLNFGSGKESANYNIGLYPFCNRYKEEIAKDYKLALDSYNKVVEAYNVQQKNGEGGEGENTEAQPENSSVQTKVYNTFYEAFASDHINENLTESQLNESILASLAISLGTMGVSKLGQFVFSKIGKNGKPEEGSEKKVQVTKESIREVCYAIMFNYMDKYVNMEKVFTQLGIDTKSLSDLDKSSCEKLKGLLKKYEKPEKNDYTKMYGRIKAAYDKMLSHYYKIGDGVIKNFEKYTKADDEKHANLLVSAKEKLQGMWDAQKDIYDSNFSHVLIEIVSCDAYIGYLNFIIENVIPIFETGSAGNADYILDVTPRKNQFYVVRQTEGQPWLEENEKQKGNVAIVKVLSFDDKTKEIELSMVGLVKSDYTVTDGVATIPDDADIDYDAYKNDNGESKTVKIAYGKFLSMDPAITAWNGRSYSEPYFRVIKDQEGQGEKSKGGEIADYIYACGDNQSDKYDSIAFVSYNGSEYTKKELFKLPNPMSKEEFQDFVELKSDNKEENMEFKKLPANKANGYIQAIEYIEKDDVKASGTKEIAKNINDNKNGEFKPSIKKSTVVYKRSITVAEQNREIDEYIFAEISSDLESVLVGKDTQRLYDHVYEADDSSDSIEIVKSDSADAEKDLVTKIYYANTERGTEISSTSTVENSKSTHAVIEINPACSIKDFVSKVEELNPKFEEFAGDDKVIRKFIIDGITKKTDIVEKKYEIGNIEDALKYVENKSNDNGSDGDVNIDNVIKEITDKCYKIPREPKSFGLRKILKKSDNSPLDNSAQELIGVVTDNVDQNGCFSVASGIKKDGKDVTFDVYPVVMYKEDKSSGLGFIIVFGNNKLTVNTGPNFKNAIENLISAYKENKTINDDPLFKYAVEAVNVFKKNGENKQNKSTEYGDIPENIKMSLGKAFEGVNITNGVFDLPKGFNPHFADENVKVDFVTDKNGKCNELQIGFKDTSDEQKNDAWVSAKGILKEDGSMTVFSLNDNNSKMDVDPKNMSALRNAVYTVNKKNVSDKQPDEKNTNNQQTQNKQQQIKNNKPSQPKQTRNKKQTAPGTSNAPSMATGMVNNMNAEKNKMNNDTDAVSDSIQISYSVDNVIHESLGTKTVVTRSFDDYMPKWCVLSESVYDDGNGRSTKLDSPSIRRRMLTRSDVMKFVKSNNNARIMESAYDHTYEITDYRGYAPSVSTPLYESVMLVKFDNEGNITGKHYIGNNKIQ